MKPTGRLSLFANAELTVESPGYYSTEHEVIGECKLTGIAQFKSIWFQPWTFGEEVDGEKRMFFLRFPGQVTGGMDGPDLPEQMQQELHSGMSAQEEFVSLACVFLRRRLWLGATTKVDQRPHRSESTRKAPAFLGKEGQSLSHLPAFLDTVSLMSPERQAAYILACRFYHQGLKLYDVDPELAYLMHVSSIEVLASSRKNELPPQELIDPDDLTATEQIPDLGAREELQRNLAHKGRLAAGFSDTIFDLTSASFFVSDPPRPQNWITPVNLKILARNVYEVRSQLLHRGIPFDENCFSPSFEGEEIPPGISINRGHNAKKNLDFDPTVNRRRIPYLTTFERLVNHILVRFSERS